MGLPTFENDLNELLDKTQLHPSIIGIHSIANIDFSKPDYFVKIKQACSGSNVDVIIHLAALSSPAFCEKNACVAWKVNCPVDLLQFKAPIIYMSTDQVYEGTKQFYNEKDDTIPVNVYGRSKLGFERVLLRTTCGNGPLLTKRELGSDSVMPTIKSTPELAAPNSVILRSSLILGPPTPFRNGCKKGAFPSFLQFIESRLQSSTSTDYFVNEFRSVVHINDVIKTIKHFLHTALSLNDAPSAETRVVNLGGSTRAARYDIALEVANHMKLDSSSANAVNRPTNGSGVPSPLDISMDVVQLTHELGVQKMASLKDIVAATFM